MASAHAVTKYLAGMIEFSHLKLQKLLYYTQAICLVRYNKPAFDDKIEAWDYGPVIPSIYERYKGIRSTLKISPPKHITLDTEIMLSADMCAGFYGKMTAAELIRETHSEKPWQDAYAEGKNNEIPLEAIKKYYATIFQFGV